MLLLSFTSVDPNNPYIREWSIVLIRNLTESKYFLAISLIFLDNEKIQQKIGQLKAIDLDSKSKELLKKFKYQVDASLLKKHQ